MPRIGIDLGTTNTAVGMVYDDGAHVLPRNKPELIPSVVYCRWANGEDDVLVGREAFNAGSERRVIRSVKRLMGRTYDEAVEEEGLEYFRPDRSSVRLLPRGETDLALEVRKSPSMSRLYWPHQISAVILKEAKRHAEAALRATIDGAIITVPAYFRDPHRAATLDAAREAGIELLGPLIDEPTAAALAFAPVVGFQAGEQVLVVDWGGGTFDVTVQMTRQAEWVQVAVAGALTLGGDDIDRAMVAFALERAGQSDDVLDDDLNQWTLLETARETKEQLSDREEAAFAPRNPVVHPDTGRPVPPINCLVRRSDFEGLLKPFIARTTSVLEECLAKPDVDRDGIRKVLLVGGSSRIRPFRESLSRLLPGARLCDDVDPMEAVALGAAIYANGRATIARICPYGYEVLDGDGNAVQVIPPDTEVPTPEHLHFGLPAKTSYAAQTLYRMNVRSFEPHRNGLRTVHDLQRYFGREMPPTAIGTNVDVELWLDENKTLKARCHIAGKQGVHELEGRQEGDRELFGRVANVAFEGEALLEANQNESKGLIEKLRASVGLAKLALNTRDRVEAERVELALKELAEQFDDKQHAMASAALPAAQRARGYVSGWASFFEESLLPFFWDVLPNETRESAVQLLRGINVTLQTGAPVENAQSQLRRLEDTLYNAPIGLAVRAWRDAGTLGMPERLAARLKIAARNARDHFRDGDRSAYNDDVTELNVAMAEANAAWDAWHATGDVLDARPDLVIRKAPSGVGD